MCLNSIILFMKTVKYFKFMQIYLFIIQSISTDYKGRANCPSCIGLGYGLGGFFWGRRTAFKGRYARLRLGMRSPPPKGGTALFGILSHLPRPPPHKRGRAREAAQNDAEEGARGRGEARRRGYAKMRFLTAFCRFWGLEKLRPSGFFGRYAPSE